MRAVSSPVSSSWRPSRKRATLRTCSAYQALSTVITHGAGQRLIWYWRQGAARGELGVGAGAELEVLVDEVQRAPRRWSPSGTGRSSARRRARAGAPSPAGASPSAVSRRRQRKSLSSRSLTLKRGWCCLMRSFSRTAASFSVEVTTVSRSRTMRAEDGDEVARVARRLLEVALHARAQALGLAHVDDGAGLVLEQVAARRLRQLSSLARSSLLGVGVSGFASAVTGATVLESARRGGKRPGVARAWRRSAVLWPRFVLAPSLTGPLPRAPLPVARATRHAQSPRPVRPALAAPRPRRRARASASPTASSSSPPSWSALPAALALRDGARGRLHRQRLRARRSARWSWSSACRW